MLKLKQFSKHSPCFYCGAPPPSSQEHVPPQAIFKGIECDSLTVPACEKHNTKRSGTDQAIATALAMSVLQLHERGMAAAPPMQNVKKALEAAKPHFVQAKKDVGVGPYLLAPPPGLPAELVYVNPGVNLTAWMRQLTAALVWKVTGEFDPTIRWDESWVWSPCWSPGLEPRENEAALRGARTALSIEAYLRTLVWHPGWSSRPTSYPPDIYVFQVCLVASPQEWEGKDLVFQHRFYNSLIWYVWFAASPTTRAAVEHAVGHCASTRP